MKLLCRGQVVFCQADNRAGLFALRSRRIAVIVLGMAVTSASASIAAPASAATLNDLTSVQIVGNVPFDYQLQTARKLGVHRVRLAVFWNSVERPRGHYSWQRSDDRVKAVLNAGMVPIIVLFGPNGGYPSADGGEGAPPSTPEAAAGFARFAAATAARYGAGQPGVPIIYEIWNEPNTKTFWKRPPDPEAYARMAEGACRAIKATTPAARVVGLGMEGTPVKTPYFVKAYDIDIYRQWAARATTPALMGCVDGISFHPYLPRPEMVLRDEPALRAFLADRWRRPTPPMIVLTEWGYNIDTRHGRTAEVQAALNLRALLIGTGLGRVTNLYQSVDGGRDATKPDQTYGLVTYDGKYKPAGLAVQRLLRAIGDYRIDGVAAVSGKPGLYRFAARRGGAAAQVMWFDGKAGTTTVPLPAGASALDLVTGAPAPVGGGQVTVGGSPVLMTTGT